MFWRDSLKIGVERIDEQHEMLFSKVHELAIDLIHTGEYKREKIISTILFLKEYAVIHFADEEAYQISINDKNYKQHKQLHENFIATVLKHEAIMAASDFAQKDVSKFAGTLLAWLTYHVSDVDQKIGKIAEDAEGTDSHADIICGCFCDVIGVEIDNKGAIAKIKEHDETFDNSIKIKHSFTHVVEGTVIFDFSISFVRELLNKLFYSIIGISPNEAEIDDFEKSLLLQIATTIIENIYRRLHVDEYEFSDAEVFIAEADEAKPNERIAFDTGIGIVEVGFTIT
ncbi:MAG: hypothetical protein FWG31_07625 [Oscillospiraceae bacterium]|nr:hypothetical protein [Oscillospiraceae bacterium]